MMTLREPKPDLDQTSEDWAASRMRASSGYSRWAEGVAMVFLLVVFFGPKVRGAENGKTKVDLLIARNQVQDPYFRHSVVLMLPETETELVVGLIINKPTRFSVSKIFPDTPEFKGRSDLAYFGGPVDIRTPSIVFRSSTAPENAAKLFGDVYLTFDSDLIAKAFQSPQASAKTRLFLGRAQWAPGQLANEVRRGGWYRIQAEGNLVFSSHPENLWRTLHAQAAPSKYIEYRLPSDKTQPPVWKASVM